MAFTQLLCDSGGELLPPSSEMVTPHTFNSLPSQCCSPGLLVGHRSLSWPSKLSQAPILDVCPWAPMEPSPHSRLSPPIQKPGFGGHTVLCPHSSAQPYGGQTKVLMHLHPFRRDGGGMVCSLGKTNPLATEMIKVAPVSQRRAPHHHHYHNA